MKVTSAARLSFFSAAKRRRCACSYTALCFADAAPVNEVLVAAAGQVDHHQMVFRFLRRELDNLGERVRRLERRNDAFELGQS